MLLEPPLSLSRSLKLSVLGIAVLIAGCNKEAGDKAQPQPSASASAPSGGAETLKGTLDRSHKGEAMPDATLTDATGKSARLDSFKGKPLLLNLWATWCAPCVIELPMLDKLAAGGTRVLTVSQDMTKTEAVAPFLAGKGLTHLEPWLDPKNDLAFHYQAQTLPTTILYDAAGKEVWRYTGGQDWSSAGAAKLIAEAGA
jgi:thiol-disulfide isomerase/thioredoxin